MFDIGNHLDDGLTPVQKISLTQLRLQRAKIKKLAAQRKAQQDLIDIEAQDKLKQLNDELEQLELETLLANQKDLTPEQQKRLDEFKWKTL